MSSHKGHIAVDLDGTLALYDGWKGPAHIGEPIPKMLARVKAWLAQGIEVRILTARVSLDNPARDASIPAIAAWCRKHLGADLPLTSEKTYETIELWDDRAIQVIPNTGDRADRAEEGQEQTTAKPFPGVTWEECSDGKTLIAKVGCLKIGTIIPRRFSVWETLVEDGACSSVEAAKQQVENFGKDLWAKIHGGQK